MSGFSQTKIEKLFSKENYHSVIEILKEKEKTGALNLNDCEFIALSYYYNNDYTAAYPYFEKISTSELFVNKNKFFFSHCIKAMGDQNLANNLLKDYFTSNNLNYDKNFEDIETHKKLGDRYNIENMNKINTEYSDMFSSLHNENLYYSSTKPVLLATSKYKWNDQPFLDNYVFNLKDEKKQSFSSINSDVHDSDISINKYNDVIYFTSSRIEDNIYLKKNETIQTKIYQASFDDNKLIELICLPFNSNTFSCKTPFIDADQKRLYFSSNKPGGFGGFDVYYIELNNPSEMINVGKDINTINDEDNFYLDSNKNIYFSSNGYVGFGGKDVYTKTYNTEINTYSRVMNVGTPVNTSSDDFGYKVIENKGYFTSNRKGGKGDDDIYKFTVTKPLELDKIIQYLKGVVYDSKTNQPILNAKIIVKGNENNNIEITTDNNGAYNTELLGNKKYILNTSAPLYKSSDISLSTNSNKYETVIQDVLLEMSECRQKFSGNITNRATSGKMKNVSVKLIDTNNKVVASTTTNENGDYIIYAPCNQTLLFSAGLDNEEAPYYAEYQEYIETDATFNSEHIKNIQLIPVDSRGLISDKNGNILIPTKPIYFAYNSSTVESVSYEELDKVIALMKEHSNWKLIIESHSDMRGKDSYNLILSNKRAESTKKYMLQRGIEPGRIICKGFGKTRPLIDCITKECSEEEHGINRRSEFIIK